MKETVRTFIAIPIHDSVKKRIADLQRELILTRADVKWVKPGNVHITLKFLGDVETGRITEIKQTVIYHSNRRNGRLPERPQAEGAVDRSPGGGESVDRAVSTNRLGAGPNRIRSGKASVFTAPDHRPRAFHLQRSRGRRLDERIRLEQRTV
jgi:hypothetical protein